MILNYQKPRVSAGFFYFQVVTEFQIVILIYAVSPVPALRIVFTRAKEMAISRIPMTAYMMIFFAVSIWSPPAEVT